MKGKRYQMKKIYPPIVFLLLFYLTISACGGPGSGNTAQAPLKVFATSVSGNGNLSAGNWLSYAGGQTGVAAGDAICQNLASAAGLPGTYKAWLSDSATDAYCHIQGYTGTIAGNCGQSSLPTAAGPWVRTDGVPFTATIDKLVSGEVYTPVRYDETGALVTNISWLTGTNYTGISNVGYACSDWTDGTSAHSGTFGSSNGTTIHWTAFGDSTCNGSSWHLLCMQTGSGGPLPSLTIPSSAKMVFVTSTRHNGALGGVAGGDTICQARAAALSLPHAANFKAWLSDDTTAAITHVTETATGPWYRLDGVKVADNIAALTSGTLFTSISVDETGAYTGVYNEWTGTNSAGTNNTGDNCNNWTDGTGGHTGTTGWQDNAYTGWTSWNTGVSCSSYMALYCFEDD
jgi:hypothetical protein